MNTTNTVLRWTIIGSMFLVLLTPLIVVNSYFFPFITGKAFFLRTLVELGFGLWVILAIRDRNFLPKKSGLLITVGLFALFILIADLAAVNPLKAFWSNFERMEGWLMIAHMGMYFTVLGSILNERKLWNYFFGTSLGVSVIVSIHGFLQLAGKAEIHQGSARLDASLGNAAYLAVYMLVHIFLALYMALREDFKKTPWLRVVFGVLALIETVVLYNTATRGTFLGLIIGLLIALAFYVFFEKGWPLARKVALGGIVAVIIIVGGVFSARESSFVKSNPVLARYASISLSFTSDQSQARGYIWPMAIQGFLERPVFGWGQEGFNYVFNKYYNPEMWRHESWFDRAHNVYLDWLIAGGLPGLGLYLALYLLGLWSVWKSGLSLREKAVFIGALIAYGIHNIFVFDNISSYILFFSLLAFFHAETAKKTFSGLTKVKIQEDIQNLVVIPFVAVVMVLVWYGVVVRPAQASEMLIKALISCQQGPLDVKYFTDAIAHSPEGAQEAREQLLTCSDRVVGSSKVPNAVKIQFVETAIKEIDAQIAQAPQDVRAHLFIGGGLNRIQEYALSQPYLEKAITLSPQKQTILFELGVMYINQGKTEEGLAALKKAFDSDPTYDEARVMYAAGLILADKAAQGEKLLEGREDLQTDLRVINAYTKKKNYFKVISLYKQLLEKNPSAYEHNLSLSAVYFLSGDKVSAVATLQALKKAAPAYSEQADYLIKEIQAGRNPVK